MLLFLLLLRLELYCCFDYERLLMPDVEQQSMLVIEQSKLSDIRHPTPFQEEYFEKASQIATVSLSLIRADSNPGYKSILKESSY